MNKNTFKILIISVIIVLIGFCVYFFVFDKLNKKTIYTHLKKYGVNEYIPTYVSSEDMAKIYFNDYMYYMRYNMEEAYRLLDEEYRNAKFSSFDSFKVHINKNINLNQKLKQYSKYVKEGYTIYKLYLNNGDVLIFKTKGVMQYSVYLDEDTVEIG